MGGDVPSEIDCVLFGFLTTILYTLPEDNTLRIVVEKRLGNLLQFTKRMKNNVYPDWEDIIGKNSLTEVKKKEEEEKPPARPPPPAPNAQVVSTPKPIQNTSKPTQSTQKPIAQDAPKPTQAAQVAPKPTQKPAQMTPNPSQSTQKPAQNAPKPAQSATRTAAQSATKSAQNATKSALNELKATFSSAVKSPQAQKPQNAQATQKPTIAQDSSDSEPESSTNPRPTGWMPRSPTTPPKLRKLPHPHR